MREKFQLSDGTRVELPELPAGYEWWVQYPLIDVDKRYVELKILKQRFWWPKTIASVRVTDPPKHRMALKVIAASMARSLK